jgi:hypothetical protein
MYVEELKYQSNTSVLSNYTVNGLSEAEAGNFSDGSSRWLLKAKDTGFHVIKKTHELALRSEYQLKLLLEKDSTSSSDLLQLEFYIENAYENSFRLNLSLGSAERGAKLTRISATVFELVLRFVTPTNQNKVEFRLLSVDKKGDTEFLASNEGFYLGNIRLFERKQELSL